jgi:hypothetical protein
MSQIILVGYELLLPNLDELITLLVHLLNQRWRGKLKIQAIKETLAFIAQQRFEASQDGAAVEQQMAWLRKIIQFPDDHPKNFVPGDINFTETELLELEIRYAYRERVPLVCLGIEKYQQLCEQHGIEVDLFNADTLNTALDQRLLLNYQLQRSNPLSRSITITENHPIESENLREVIAEDYLLPITDAEELVSSDVDQNPQARSSEAKHSSQGEERPIRQMDTEGRRIKPTLNHILPPDSNMLPLLVLLLAELLTRTLTDNNRSNKQPVKALLIDLTALTNGVEVGVLELLQPKQTAQSKSELFATSVKELSDDQPKADVPNQPFSSRIVDRSNSEFSTAVAKSHHVRPETQAAEANTGWLDTDVDFEAQSQFVAVTESSNEAASERFNQNVFENNGILPRNDVEEIAPERINLDVAAPPDELPSFPEQPVSSKPKPSPKNSQPIADPEVSPEPVPQPQQPLPAMPLLPNPPPDDISVEPAQPPPQGAVEPSKPSPDGEQPREPEQPSPSNDPNELANPAGKTVFEIGAGKYTIKNFGGVGQGITPTPEVVRNVDTLKLNGSGLKPENLLLNQRGNDLVITFETVSEIEIILEDFRLENLDNLTTATWASVTVGNIVFNQQIGIEDSIDVIDAELPIEQVLRPDTVTFLNSLDNETAGREDSNDVIDGLDGNDRLSGLSGDDKLRGGAGDDQLLGGSGDNYLLGGMGDDLLEGGSGRNLFNGGGGRDQFVLSPETGSGSVIEDFRPGEDLIKLTGGITPSQIATQIDGNNTLLLFNDQPLITLLGVQISNSSILFG